MGFRHSIVLFFAVISSSLAFTAEYVPKSYYVIHNGVESPIVFLRDKRSFPLSRMRRSEPGSQSGSGSGSYAGSFASSSAGAGTGAGGGNDAVFFADNWQQGLEMVKKLSGFPDGFPGFPGNIPGAPQGFGVPGAGIPTGKDLTGHGNGIAPNFESRFGGNDGTSYSGSAEGARGVYSASSSSIDGEGNVKYSVKTGKF